jgi:hypothetical protein
MIGSTGSVSPGAGRYTSQYSSGCPVEVKPARPSPPRVTRTIRGVIRVVRRTTAR